MKKTLNSVATSKGRTFQLHDVPCIESVELAQMLNENHTGQYWSTCPQSKNP
jgi:hypothetical protein